VRKPRPAGGPAARGFFHALASAAPWYTGTVRPLPPHDPPASAPAVDVVEVTPAGRRSRSDEVAAEEPLLVELRHGPPADRRRTPLGVTLRTPGRDNDLALGMLFAEGVIRAPAEVLRLTVVAPNHLRADLRPDVTVDVARLARHGIVTAACGLCGKTTLDAIELDCPPLPPGPAVAAAVLHGLPARLRAAQPLFARTGGLHAAGSATAVGELVAVREDIGRHNAVDKLVGAGLLAGGVPPVMVVSGRAGLELVQKAALAGVTVFAAVGAPSSLAVELARRVGLTLAGFVTADRFNLYAHPERITP
jgi:FdhD protein